MVRDQFTSLPDYSDPDFAAGYAKVDEPSSDIDTLLSTRTDDVFASLMQIYCSRSTTPQPVQWEFAAYNSSGLREAADDGITCTTGCAASGCDFHSCDGIPVISCAHTVGELTFDVDALVANGSIPAANAQTVLTKLQSAESAIDAGAVNAAQGHLLSFVNSVQALAAAQRIPSDSAAVLVAVANAIIAGL